MDNVLHACFMQSIHSLVHFINLVVFFYLLSYYTLLCIPFYCNYTLRSSSTILRTTSRAEVATFVGYCGLCAVVDILSEVKFAHRRVGNGVARRLWQGMGWPYLLQERIVCFGEHQVISQKPLRVWSAVYDSYSLLRTSQFIIFVIFTFNAPGLPSAHALLAFSFCSTSAQLHIFPSIGGYPCACL